MGHVGNDPPSLGTGSSAEGTVLSASSSCDGSAPLPDPRRCERPDSSQDPGRDDRGGSACDGHRNRTAPVTGRDPLGAFKECRESNNWVESGACSQ